MPSITYRRFFSLPDLEFAASQTAYFAYESGQMEVIFNDSKQDTTSARLEVFNLAQLSGPRDIATFTMTEYYTVYTNFGIITFQDVKIGTNTSTVNLSTTYGNFATVRKLDLITLTRTLLYDRDGAIYGMNLDLNLPVIE